jgi:predicted phosphodiesterase
VRQALISDIHGNLEALSAVMADVAARKVDRIICLGDMVGYGPNPCQCLDIVMDRCALTILGNHDQAALFDPDGFNPVALRAIYWTRDELDRGPGPASAINRRWDFLSELPKSHKDGNVMFVHGSPRDPTDEYVFPEAIYDQSRMRILFDRVAWICFQGHTHMPGVFTQDSEFITPEECNYSFGLIESEKIMVNVGSVGQPRDEDRRSCYAIHDSAKRTIEFHRVDYDFEKTARKIYDIPNLDNMLGDRLRNGR